MKTELDYNNWFNQLSLDDKETTFNSYQIEKEFRKRYNKKYLQKESEDET